MVEFYKRRDFGAIITDTFNFFKKHGKNYFKNYFAINGLLIILMMAVVALYGREFITLITAAPNNPGAFTNYFQDNQTYLIIGGILTLFIFMTASVLNYTFPAFYMKRLTATGEMQPSGLLSDIREDAGRLMILLVGTMFIVVPASFILVGISYLLVLILVGFILLFFVIPIIANVYNFLIFDYIHTKKGFFESLSYAIRAQFSYRRMGEKTPFWKYWGATVVMYMIVQTIVSVITTIPMLIFMFSAFTNPETGKMSNPFEGTFGIVMIIFYALSILLSMVGMNLSTVAAGMMYYDSRTDLQTRMNVQEIDQIGNGL